MRIAPAIRPTQPTQGGAAAARLRLGRVARGILTLLGAIALGLLAWPDGRGLVLGGVLGGLSLWWAEGVTVRRYLPARTLRRVRS